MFKQKSEDCVFCKIVNGEIPSNKLYEDENFILIKDINPKAKVHLLAIIKQHYPLIKNIPQSKSEVIGSIIHIVSTNAKKFGLENGFRIIVNQGVDANPLVKHFHIHFLGGERLIDLP